MPSASLTNLAARLRQARGLHRPLPEVQLDYRRIYILPTRHGLGFVLALVVMLLGAINYQLSLGYVLVFLLAGTGTASMFHAFRNLNRLVLRPGRVQAVFAGDMATFTLSAVEGLGLARHGVVLRRGQDAPIAVDIPARGASEVAIRVPAPHRGRLRPGQLLIFTRYPLGLFHAWSWIDLDVSCYVYPRPSPHHPPFPGQQAGMDSAPAGEGGGDPEDFAGLRDYQPGDSLRQVAWKALARGQGMFTKQFTGVLQSSTWFDLHEAPAADLEGKLAILCRWILDAHGLGLVYGLKLPDQSVAPDCGEAHMRRCLEALAMYGQPRLAGP